jgi:dihydropteroate synthase
MKVLREVSGANSLKVQTVEKIIYFSQNNIRKIIKSGIKKDIDKTDIEIQQMIHTCINLFTSVPLDKQNQKDVQILISMSKDFIIENFQMLNVNEILDAFKLASLGKTDASLQTYHGKFTIDMLSNVLKNYLKYRNKIICEFNDREKRISKEQQQEQIKQKNQEARKQIIQLFEMLKKQFHETGEFDENRIKPYQAKILIDAGMIDIPEDEKRQIFKQAKINVQKRLKSDISNPRTKSTEIRSLRNMLKSIESGQENSSLKSQIISEYSILLIKKSIIK